MSDTSSMPPISSLHRYLSDAHDSLETKKNERTKHGRHDKNHEPHKKDEKRHLGHSHTKRID